MEDRDHELAQTLEAQGDSSKLLLGMREFVAMAFGIGGMIVTLRQKSLEKARKNCGIPK